MAWPGARSLRCTTTRADHGDAPSPESTTGLGLRLRSVGLVRVDEPRVRLGEVLKMPFLVVESFVEPCMTNLVSRLVPDELWALFRRVVPPNEVIRPQGGGRRRAGDREALAAIVFVATSGCTWRHLPPVFGPSWQTVYRRFAQWSRARVWARLHRVVLDELEFRGELDWSRCAIDSDSLRAAKGGR